MRRQNKSGRRRIVADGGEIFCAACGEPYDANKGECPACGLSKDGSPGDPEPSAASEPRGSSATRPAETGGGAGTSIPKQSVDSGVLKSNRDEPDSRTTETSETEGTADANRADSGDQSAITSTRDRTEAGPNQEYCSSCGEVIAEDADTCPYCGADRGGGGSGDKKSPFVAGILSLVVPGAGHVYALDIERGAKVFLAFLAGLVLTGVTAGVGALAVIGVWLWGTYDAYSRTTELWT